MATGLEGIAIEVGTTPPTVFEIQRGLKGVAMEADTKQYFEIQVGFKGIALEGDIGGRVIKIYHT